MNCLTLIRSNQQCSKRVLVVPKRSTLVPDQSSPTTSSPLSGRCRGERDHAGSAAPVEPLPSRRPTAAAASGITPAGADPAGRPKA